ncbi:MAG: PD-(D/E)XK nuclease family protein [Verrucomicrobia bacterium]|nr:PD-(D/E)XK nuclease family protein [Verrucomicrobiota bacterium]
MALYKQDELFTTISGGADERVFIDWSAPLLDAAVAELVGDWSGGLLDLSALLVVVPTRAAGRRLREALAVFAAQRDAAVIPPMTVPPDFLTQLEDSDQVASQLETLLAWISTLQAVDIQTCPHLFPIEPVDRGFSWALQTAMQLERLRNALGEGGLTIVSAVRKFGKVLDEIERWKELANLERQMIGILRRGGKEDCLLARAAAAESATLPDGITSVVLMATPDPSALAVLALERLSTSAHTKVIIYAPEDLQTMFDSWGRPIATEWIGREIPIPDAESTIHLAANPRAQAKAVVGLLEKYSTPGSVSIGVPDGEVAPHLESVLGEQGVACFNPDGVPFARHELAHTLAVLGDLLRTRSFGAFSALTLNPEFLRAAGRDAGEDWAPAAVLAELDALRDNHLPDSIDDLADAIRRGTKVSPATARLIKIVADGLDDFGRAGSAGFGDCLLRWLAFIYGHREFRSDTPEDAAFSTIAGEMSAALDGLESKVARAAKIRLAPADSLELVQHALSGIAFYREREGDDLDLQGWLELLWDDAPHLIITGCNDGSLPEAIVGDPFLPNQARVLLGIKDNERRLGRDAYLLSSMLACRASHGRVDFVVGRTRNNGDPLRPSRLLLQCSDDLLPTRALQLFQGETSSDEIAPPPWQRAWKLKPLPLPDDARIRSRISVTAFAAFLSCPFRFYLAHGLGMREVDAEKQEMNPMEFGNLCHDALERLGRDETMRACPDEREVKAFLLDAADRYVERRYGKVVTVPVQVQLETARQRLAWAAEEHVRDLALGWRIEEVEWRFDRELPWEIGGLQISGTIDRIDRNRNSGAIRVLDYKTADKPTPPADAHLAPLKRTENPDELRQWLLFDRSDGRKMRWINLQLPLYVLALRRGVERDTPISASYFNMPRAAGETAISTWNGLNEDVLEQAMHCAAAAAKAIRAEEFWPPSSRPKYEDFGRLFFGDAQESVAPFSNE